MDCTVNTGLEIRTLEIAQPATSPSNLQYSGRNMVFVDEDGQVTFHFQNYKTVKTYGADQTVLKVIAFIIVLLLFSQTLFFALLSFHFCGSLLINVFFYPVENVSVIISVCLFSFLMFTHFSFLLA